MTIDEVISVLEMQEEILQFSHFTNADAWTLGNMLVAEAQRRGSSVMISIRLNNGFTVFQYGFDGTNLYNENWISRKQKTVMVTEKSSLHLAMVLRRSGETLENMMMDPKEFAASGGGFPIRVEEVGVIGSVLVSGMDPVSDHDLIIKAVSRYLHIDEVPRIRAV